MVNLVWIGIKINNMQLLNSKWLCKNYCFESCRKPLRSSWDFHWKSAESKQAAADLKFLLAAFFVGSDSRLIPRSVLLQAINQAHKMNSQHSDALWDQHRAVGWQKFNGIFCTIRVHHAFTNYSMVKRLISVRKFLHVIFGNTIDSWLAEDEKE